MTSKFKSMTKKSGLTNASLNEAIKEFNGSLRGRGILLTEDKDGNKVYKKRISLPEKGKSNGVRSILLYVENNMLLFLVAYPKSAQDKLTPDQEKALKQKVALYSGLDSAGIQERIEDGTIIEIQEG